MLLKNANILILNPSQAKPSDLRIIDGEIKACGKTLRPQRGEEVLDLKGKYIMPGMVCAHTHLYSSLARGMSGPKQPPKNFLEILKKIWWKLDEALDEESIYYSALVGAIEAVKYGTTTLFDHHASPNAITGSLDVIKEAVNKVGLRSVLCYETTDRGGKGRRDEGLKENERFITENTNSSHFRGTVGAHASFTLNDETLSVLGDLARMYDCGVHIHLAEDIADVRDARSNRRIDIIKRLEKFGVLRRKSILAHGVHLDRNHFRMIDASGAWFVHNPRSNMNNSVGYAPLNLFGKNSALGTDGFPADMFEETKYGFFRNRDSEHKVEFPRLPEMLWAGQKLASSFFGKAFGTLKEGSPADLIVMDYKPPTLLTSANLLGHFLFGMNSTTVESVMIAGKWVVKNRDLAALDEREYLATASKVAEKMWKKMEKM